MTGHRRDIDGLRAVAVLAVVLAHADVPGLAGGFVGVDVFFVISGYLITGIVTREIAEGHFAIARFYERRVRRIFPALFVMLAAVSVLAAILLLPDDLDHFGRSLLATAFFVSNLHFNAQTGYFDSEALDKPLLHTWSLAVEEQFYLVLPPLLMLWATWSGRRWLPLLLPLAMLSFAVSVWMTAHQREAAFFLFQSRAWELLLGGLLATAPWPQLDRRPMREAAAAAGLLAIVAAIVLYDDRTPFPGYAALAPCLGAALLLHAGASGPTLIGALLSLGPMVIIGLISYSLYLWHWPLLVLSRYWTIVELTPAWRFGVILISLVLAAQSWRFVEQPFRRRGVLAWRRSLFTAAAAITVGAAALGWFASRSDGWPGRLDPEIVALAAGARDVDAARRACHDPDAEQVTLDKLCRLGAVDLPSSFLLWGDSHADALAPAFDLLARERGIGGLRATGSACNPLVAATGRADCDRFNAAVREVLATTPVETVVLAAHWLVAGLTDDRVATTVDFLRRLGKRVVIVRQVPEQPHNGASAVARLARLGQPAEALSLTPVEHRRRTAGIEAVLDQVAAALGAVQVDPADALCDENLCRSVASGRSLYRDSNHLSGVGAAHIRHALARAIAPPAAIPLPSGAIPGRPVFGSGNGLKG